jgi:hypothetical protein
MLAPLGGGLAPIWTKGAFHRPHRPVMLAPLGGGLACDGAKPVEGWPAFESVVERREAICTTAGLVEIRQDER